MDLNLVNGMKRWKECGNITILLFSSKGLEILHQERRGQVNAMAIKHSNSIFFHKPGPANKEQTYQSINDYKILQL
jgi:hypothetical protein